MYKFNNGVVVFTEEDKENFLKAGFTLVEEKKEEKHEKNDNDAYVTREFGKGKKTNSRFQR